ncbi:retrovirus-related pol polyprotein from transposon TNT 1-94 [Tanacetum coccineum]
MNTQCASNTLDSLSQKLDDENVSLEFQVLSLEKRNKHLNAQLQAKFSKQNVALEGTSVNTISATPSTLGTTTPFLKTRFIPKVVKRNVLSKAVTSHSKHKANVKKSKKLCSEESLALPRPRKLKLALGGYLLEEFLTLVANYLTVVTLKLRMKHLSYRNLFMVRQLGLFQAYDQESKATHQLRLELYGNYLEGKSKKTPHKPKPITNTKNRLHLLHMDLCGPMRVESMHGKRYVLVIMDDNSRYTWVHLLKSKDEAPKSDATRTAPAAPATLNPQTPNASITTAKTAPTPTNSSTEALVIPNSS